MRGGNTSAASFATAVSSTPTRRVCFVPQDCPGSNIDSNFRIFKDSYLLVGSTDGDGTQSQCGRCINSR